VRAQPAYKKSPSWRFDFGWEEGEEVVFAFREEGDGAHVLGEGGVFIENTL